MTVASETALETAPGALEADRYDAVLVAGAGMSEATLARVLAVCDRRGIDVLLHPELDAMLVAGGEMNSLGGVPVVALAPALDRTAYGFTKRLLDIAVSVTLGLLLLPFLLGLGALVRLTSRGPALFVQERVGVRGQPFRMLKFRTMVQGAEAASGPVLSGPDDPRVTALGRLMRRTRLDEAPQLWNVATGAMSLVGPRPERPEFVARYEEANPFYARRHLVRPGLTGLAQVHGRYDSDYAHKLRYDLMYVNSASFGMDLRLLFATVRIVITGAGAQ
jgi:exopolysaccharide biosynthesis polyprenyl glycosylphosphotransferase